jgi:hypothetical protein
MEERKEGKKGEPPINPVNMGSPLPSPFGCFLNLPDMVISIKRQGGIPSSPITSDATPHGDISIQEHLDLFLIAKANLLETKPSRTLKDYPALLVGD